MILSNEEPFLPGVTWGPFTTRIPFVHTGVCWPELLQGILVAGATGLALVPLLTRYFGLSFEESIGFIAITSILICSAPILFGEPYAPGWITPALPLVLLTLLATDRGGQAVYATHAERFQFMTAVSLNFTALLFLLGITGLGRRLMHWMPDTLKAGIILGAAIAALKRVFLDDAERYLLKQPITTTAALAVCLVLTFSVPLHKFKQHHRWLSIVAGLGLLPGFVVAAIVGPMVSEVTYHVEWGILIPPFGSLFDKISPFRIGWPSAQMFVETIPLALMTYVILFGDLITGSELLRQAAPSRQDDAIDTNLERSHFSLAIRNGVMALFAPFFPTQGALWTGVHVIVVQRWREGRTVMPSLFTGISSYYVFGIPVLYFVRPVLTMLQPLMGIALSLTLVLTGFACAYIAMEIPRTPIERGVVLLMAVTLALFANPWVGMTVGIVATFTLVGVGGEREEPR